MNSPRLDSVRNRGANQTREPTESAFAPERPHNFFHAHHPFLEPPQRCQVVVGGSDISKSSSYPREAELLLKKKKKKYQFNSGASWFLTLGGKNGSTAFLLH